MATEKETIKTTIKANKSLIPEGYKGTTRRVTALAHPQTSLHVGHVYDVPEAQAKAMIKSKLAESFEE